MHRLVRGAQLGALVGLVALVASTVACSENDVEKLLAVIDASGGDGHPIDGSGGDGGDERDTGAGIAIHVLFDGGSSIDVLQDGQVDASFTPTAVFNPELGVNPLVVDADLEIDVVTDEPPTGTPYALEGDASLYVSDGDSMLGDEPPVTGLRVASGVTLTLPLNWDEGGGRRSVDIAHFEFGSDIVHDGDITVVDFDASRRGSIWLASRADYIGSGRLRTFGQTAGQSGGDITVGVEGDGFNSGLWQSHGADNIDGDAGDGGKIDFFTEWETLGGLIENTGDMASGGGDASGATGSGGDAGGVEITPYLALWNSGDLDASGGSGVQDGGDGANVLIAGFYRGELRNTGDLTADGGDAETGDGGAAARVSLHAWGADLRSSGSSSSRGGDTAGPGQTGGRGASVVVFVTASDDDWEASELDVPAGDAWVSGSMIATGGSALAAGGTGGMGGHVEVEIKNDISEGDQAIHLIGFTRLDAIGGNGGLAGGDSRGIYLDVAFDDVPGTGTVMVEPPMNSSGGDADPAQAGSAGGDGADIAIFAASISYGEVLADGGTGETPGAAGMITSQTPPP